MDGLDTSAVGTSAIVTSAERINPTNPNAGVPDNITGAGELVDNGDGTWTYTPALDDDSAVTFSYTVSDGALTAAGTATLDILVRSQNTEFYSPGNDLPYALPARPG